jgi:acyl-CoA thioesterase FadM
MARHLGTTGRKTRSATSLYDADGRLVATSEQLWVAVDPAHFR